MYSHDLLGIIDFLHPHLSNSISAMPCSTVSRWMVENQPRMYEHQFYPVPKVGLLRKLAYSGPASLFAPLLGIWSLSFP